jgi:hypothetical protein
MHRITSCHPKICSKSLSQSGKDRAADAKLRGAEANPGAVADLINGIANVQNIETKFGACSDPKIELLDDA